MFTNQFAFRGQIIRVPGFTGLSLPAPLLKIGAALTFSLVAAGVLTALDRSASSPPTEKAQKVSDQNAVTLAAGIGRPDAEAVTAPAAESPKGDLGLRSVSSPNGVAVPAERGYARFEPAARPEAAAPVLPKSAEAQLTKADADEGVTGLMAYSRAEPVESEPAVATSRTQAKVAAVSPRETATAGREGQGAPLACLPAGM